MIQSDPQIHLEVQNLVKGFNGRYVLNGVSFKVKKGDIVGECVYTSKKKVKVVKI